MENASKALLIAGGVLITMIVTSLGVYLYSVYHEHSENMLAAMSEKEVTEFNSKFWAFEGKDLTANEVISILNLAWNHNYNNANKVIVEPKNTNGSNLDMAAIFLEYGFESTNSPTSDKTPKKWNEFIPKYSVIERIKVKDQNGNEVIEKGYKYIFKCKVEEYSNLGLVSKVTITSTTNEISN